MLTKKPGRTSRFTRQKPSPKLITPLFLLLAPLACVTMSEEQFAKEVMVWQGQSEAALVKKLGYPNQHHTSPDGNRVFEYTRQSQIINQTPNTNRLFWRYTWGPSVTSVKTYECRIWFELVNKKVSKITWRGNDCVAPVPDEAED